MPGPKWSEPDKAQALFAQLLKNPQDDPTIYRDAARLMSAKQPQQALDYYAKGMAGAGLITPERGQSARQPGNDPGQP